jgi:hypothetical protein
MNFGIILHKIRIPLSISRSTNRYLSSILQDDSSKQLNELEQATSSTSSRVNFSSINTKGTYLVKPPETDGKRIGFLGFGKMGQAIVGGLLDKGQIKSDKIYISDAHLNFDELKARNEKLEVLF